MEMDDLDPVEPVPAKLGGKLEQFEAGRTLGPSGHASGERESGDETRIGEVARDEVAQGPVQRPGRDHLRHCHDPTMPSALPPDLTASVSECRERRSADRWQRAWVPSSRAA